MKEPVHSAGDGLQRDGDPGPSDRFERRNASHEALHQGAGRLRVALARAQQGRETAWADLVDDHLRTLREAIDRHSSSARVRGGLYDEVIAEEPRLVPRVRQLERRLKRLSAEAADLQVEVNRVQEADLDGLSSIRTDAQHLLASLFEMMAKENDLMFERFRDLPALG